MEERLLTVMVIDDEPADIDIIRRHLCAIPDWDMKILPFRNPDQAIDEGLGREPVDLVLLDYLLGMDTGLDVLARIQERGHRVPVVALTGHGSEEVAVSMMRQGACDYLQKSAISDKSLKRTIINALERHRLQQEVERQRVDLEKANRELQRRNQEIQDFQYTVSHEIRNPLAAALEFLNMLLEDFAGPLEEDQRTFVDSARESCQVIHRQIMDLLDNTRLETGKFHLSKHTSSMPILIRRTVASMSHTARDRGITLRHDLPEDLPMVVMDATRIRQVVTNLVDNALKFTPSGGTVIVTASLTGEHEESILVEVRDTGAGIAPELHQRIFERRYQVNEKDAHGQQGLGLGLHICKEIITAHDGLLEVESEPGRGSRFHFSLPLAGVALNA